MLQEMRKYSRSLFSTILLGGLSMVFVLWGVSGYFQGNIDTNVYSVGSTSIPVESFSREYQDASKQAMASRPGDTPTPEQQRQIGQSVLTEMMLRTALDNVTNRLGLTATDARVAQQIQSIGAFSNSLGAFDHDKFVAVLAQHGFTEQGFTERSRADIARSQLIRGVEAGFVLPPDYARAIFAYIDETRAADYIVLTPSSVTPPTPPSEAVLAAYVKAHPDNFSTPEYRSVSYAGVSIADIAATIQVTDKQIQDEIDANKADYITPEKRDLEQIKFASEADAKAAKAALDGGKTFDALAAERKLKDADYKLGTVTKEDLDPSRQVFFTLPEHAVSDPVKSTFGWVIMRVAKVTPGTAKSHDEVKAVVQKKLAYDKMTTMANAYTDAVAGGASVQEAAQKAGMKYVHIPAIDDSGLAPDGKKAIDPANPELLAAIFKAEVSEDGDPFQTSDGSYFALRVDGTTPPAVKPLDAVRAQATSRWIAEQGLVALRIKAQQLAARGNAEHSLAGAASSVGAPVLQIGPLTRGGVPNGLFSPEVTRALFNTPGGGSVAVRANSNTYIVARITGIRHPVPPENDLRYQSGVSQFGREVAADVTVSLAKAVQKKDGTTINQKLVDSTIGGGSAGAGQ
jgi:peptidyl-prolyl cis-trans isomerase D